MNKDLVYIVMDILGGTPFGVYESYKDAMHDAQHLKQAAVFPTNLLKSAVLNKKPAVRISKKSTGKTKK